ncbi:MAG: YitT family protein [Bacteroidales bacterium]|nr:YitT family protein [Bacteroidales bacterium]
MNPTLYRYLQKVVSRQQERLGQELTPFEFEKNVKIKKVEISHLLTEILFVLIGVFAAGFGLKGFLLPNGFIDGGVTGMSLIAAELSVIPFPVLLVLINLPFLIIGYKSIGKQFAIRSVVAIILLAFVVHYVPYPTITNDKLLIAVFGGFFLGAGIGMAIRGGAVLDGTEVLAVFVGRKTSLTIGDVILLFNVVIFLFGAYVFSIEIALYAMLTYLAASKTVDFIVDGVEEYIGVTIISDFSDEIRVAIIENLGRGCTVYSGKKGYAKKGAELKETDIVYSLITRLELSKLKTEIDKIDDKAFLIMHMVKDARGGVIKKRPLKH